MHQRQQLTTGDNDNHLFYTKMAHKMMTCKTKTAPTALSMLSPNILGVLCAVSLLMIALMTTGCSEQPKTPQVLHITGQTMGTTYSIKWVDDEPEHQTIVQNQVEKRLALLNSHLSNYDKTSEVSEFNQKKVDIKYKASKDFFETLTIAQAVSKHTHGAFDVTIAPLINIWGFGPNGKVSKQPSQQQIISAKQATGYHKIDLLPKKRLIKKNAPVTINLSAVAKGYGVDALAETLELLRIDSYFIEIGGEVFAKGSKPNGQSWKVGIEKPTHDSRQLQEIIALDNVALATSGDYRNYFEENGVRYSHTINPVTGRPIAHKLASVSVIKKTCAEADAYATALMVLGDQQGITFAKQHHIDALFIIKTPDGFKEITSGRFASYVVPATEKRPATSAPVSANGA